MYKHAITLTCTDIDAEDLDDMTAAEMTEACPSVTPGVAGNYFSIASNDRLGVSQDHQFQSNGETGNIWGSYYSDVDGVKTKDTTSVKNNEYAQMPRFYRRGNNAFGDLYNWYAASAESGLFTTASGSVSDSLCPNGWKLSSSAYDSTGIEGVISYPQLLLYHYGLSADNEESGKISRQVALSLVRSGIYHEGNGAVQNTNGNGMIWYSTAFDSDGVRGLSILGNVIRPRFNNGSSKIRGNVIRCYKP